VRITFDQAKRAKTLAERGLDFADAAQVFAGVTLEVEDTRKDMAKSASSVLAGSQAGWWWWAIRRVARSAMYSA